MRSYRNLGSRCLPLPQFFFLEANDLELGDRQTASKQKDDLFDTLIADFGAMPKAKNTNLDNYAVVNVAPAVVPNPYLTSFRIFSYNATGSPTSLGRNHGHKRGGGKNKEALCKLDEYRDTWKCHLNDSWHSDPNSPSRSNRLWTPLGYTQVCVLAVKLCYVLILLAVLHTTSGGGEQDA